MGRRGRSPENRLIWPLLDRVNLEKKMDVPSDKDASAQRVWQQIHEIVEALLREPTRDEFVASLREGKHWVQFPHELRVKLKSHGDAHWHVIEPAIPDRCTYRIDIRRRVWWDEVLTGLIGDDDLVQKLLWWFVPSVRCASSYMQALAVIPIASRKPLRRGPQHELTNFFGYALARYEGMQELFWVSKPSSTVRYHYYEDMFPRYVKDVANSRLNRAISEARRNGELNILGPRLEALERGLRAYADLFMEHPQGNTMPTEPTPLNIALNDLMPYLDSGLDEPSPLSDARRPMTAGQKDVWDALAGQALTGPGLVEFLERKGIPTSEGVVRQHIMDLKRAGYVIRNRSGRGYYRPDSPPPEL